MAVKKTSAKVDSIQKLYDLGVDNISGYSTSVFGVEYSIAYVEHIKENIYRVGLKRGKENIIMPLSAEHSVFKSAKVDPFDEDVD